MAVSARRLLVAAAALGVAAPLAACGNTSSGGTPTLNWYIYAEPSGSFQHALDACNKQANGRYTIAYAQLPADADGQRQQLVRRLAAKDTSMDILGLDVVWSAEFSEAGWIAPWEGRRADEVRAGTLPAALDTATWRDKLVAAPLNSNTQLLWYRKDLVPNPPRTWAEMIDQANKLAAAGKPHYIEIQGAQYEGYTVWFNSMVASAGGAILGPDGRTVELGPPADRAAQVMGQMARSAGADPSLSVQKEDQNRLAFESGNAAFQINYPFIYPSAQQNNPGLAKQIGWTLYPQVDEGRPVRPPIGGFNLAVSAFSKHRDLAFDAVQCLRNRDNQLYNALKGGLPPTIESLYADPQLVQAGYPFAPEILASLKQAAVRPKTPAYQSVTTAIFTTLHPPETLTPAKIPPLRSALRDAVQSKGLIP